MALTVKAYLDRVGNPDPEIRRFSVPADVSTNYDYLAKKVAGMFPSIREGHFSLYWKDPDGDKILFSTDLELLEALGFVTDSVFKIFVSPTTKENNGIPQEPTTVHPTNGDPHVNFVCNGCNEPIRGVRFTCAECDDYDLCSTCEHRGIHSEHNMMRFTRPNRIPFYSPPHRSHGLPHFGVGRMSAPPCGGGDFAPPPHFRRWMRRFMRRWHNQNTPGCPVLADSPEDDLSPPEGTSDWIPGCPYKQRRLHKNKGGKKCGRRKPQPVIDLTGPCEQIASDVSVIMCPGPPDSPALLTDNVEDIRRKESENDNYEPDSIDLSKLRVSEELPVKEADRQPFEPSNMDVQNGGMNIDDNAWTLLRLSPAPAEVPEIPVSMPDNSVIPSAECTISSTVSNACPILAPPIVCPHVVTSTVTTQIPVVSTPPTTGQGRSQSMNSGSGHSVRFDLPPQVVYPPSNPKVAESLRQMMSMGFNNDQGWLTNLLESKNGDIIQVLDAIKPKPGRSRETNGGYMA
ncbi:Sequestosome-1 [Mactra antiquata]